MGGAVNQIRFTPGIVRYHMGGGVADNDQQVPLAVGPIHRALVDLAAGHRDAAVDLLLD